MEPSSKVVWYDDRHRAWSANEAVRKEAVAVQTKGDKPAMILSTVGLILTIICTILDGDWSMFFGYLIIFAGIVMVIGQVFGAMEL